MHIWIPKFLRPRRRAQHTSLHSVWDVQVLRADGSVRFDWTGKNAIHNIVHDEGARYLLELAFENAFTTGTNSPYCALTDGVFTQATRVMTSAGNLFAGCATGDWLYLIGGTGAAGAVTPGWYQIALYTGIGQVTMALDISSNAENLTKVMAVRVPMRRAVLYLGLDARPTLAQTDVISSAEGYEEDAVSYGRRAVDPDTAGEWTVSYNSTDHRYLALSIQETFTGDATPWQENRNGFLAAGYAAANTACTKGSVTQGQVLLSSFAFPAAFTLADGETIPVQGRFYHHLES